MQPTENPRSLLRASSAKTPERFDPVPRAVQVLTVHRNGYFDRGALRSTAIAMPDFFVRDQERRSRSQSTASVCSQYQPLILPSPSLYLQHFYGTTTSITSPLDDTTDTDAIGASDEFKYKNERERNRYLSYHYHHHHHAPMLQSSVLPSTTEDGPVIIRRPKPVTTTQRDYSHYYQHDSDVLLQDEKDEHHRRKFQQDNRLQGEAINCADVFPEKRDFQRAKGTEKDLRDHQHRPLQPTQKIPAPQNEDVWSRLAVPKHHRERQPCPEGHNNAQTLHQDKIDYNEIDNADRDETTLIQETKSAQTKGANVASPVVFLHLADDLSIVPVSKDEQSVSPSPLIIPQLPSDYSKQTLSAKSHSVPASHRHDNEQKKRRGGTPIDMTPHRTPTTGASSVVCVTPKRLYWREAKHGHVSAGSESLQLPDDGNAGKLQRVLKGDGIPPEVVAWLSQAAAVMTKKNWDHSTPQHHSSNMSHQGGHQGMERTFKLAPGTGVGQRPTQGRRHDLTIEPSQLKEVTPSIADRFRILSEELSLPKAPSVQGVETATSPSAPKPVKHLPTGHKSQMHRARAAYHISPPHRGLSPEPEPPKPKSFKNTRTLETHTNLPGRGGKGAENPAVQHHVQRRHVVTPSINVILRKSVSPEPSGENVQIFPAITYSNYASLAPARVVEQSPKYKFKSDSMLRAVAAKVRGSSIDHPINHLIKQSHVAQHIAEGSPTALLSNPRSHRTTNMLAPHRGTAAQPLLSNPVQIKLPAYRVTDDSTSRGNLKQPKRFSAAVRQPGSASSMPVVHQTNRSNYLDRFRDLEASGDNSPDSKTGSEERGQEDEDHLRAVVSKEHFRQEDRSAGVLNYLKQFGNSDAQFSGTEAESDTDSNTSAQPAYSLW